MIKGVKIKKIVKHCDDRGFFSEILKEDDEFVSNRTEANWYEKVTQDKLK